MQAQVNADKDLGFADADRKTEQGALRALDAPRYEVCYVEWYEGDHIDCSALCKSYNHEHYRIGSPVRVRNPDQTK